MKYILILITFFILVHMHRKSYVDIVTMTFEKHQEKLNKTINNLDKTTKGNSLLLLLYLSVAVLICISYVATITTYVDIEAFYYIGTIMGFVQLIDSISIYMMLAGSKKQMPYIKYVVLDKFNALISLVFCGVSSLLLIMGLVIAI